MFIEHFFICCTQDRKKEVAFADDFNSLQTDLKTDIIFVHIYTPAVL